MLKNNLILRLVLVCLHFTAISVFAAGGNTSTNQLRPFDIYWQHSSGQLGFWKVGTNSQLISSFLLNESGVAGSSWNLVTGGDFDKNGTDDLLWLHSSGTVGVWFMDGTNRLSTEVISTRSSGAWNIVGVADFDNDTNLDLLWQHPSGRLGIWYLTRIAFREAVSLNLPLPGPTWNVVGVRDFDGDNDADFLWQHNQGSLGWWKMDGTNMVEATALPFAPVGPTWNIVAVKDMNADGSADFVWQNNKGELAIWEMSGFTRLSTEILPLPKAPGWKPKAFLF